MVKSTGIYQGGLNAQLTHGPSGRVIETDAPKDNHGRGAAFSPTDLTTASFASCMVTTMAIAAKVKLGRDIPGVRWEVTKEMSADVPRRIVRIATEIWIPFPRSIDPEGVLEKAALNCPVHHSLHPAIARPVTFHWQD
ncbi:MAG TPA: OsmC family protein [Gemmatimonadaceae bacterium]|nr:OsmC family protein [Gemmatimonadaceae bacterium]